MANRNIENYICKSRKSEIIYRSKEHNTRMKIKFNIGDKHSYNRYTVPKKYLIMLKNGDIIEVNQKIQHRFTKTIKNKKNKKIGEQIVDRYLKTPDSISYRVLSTLNNNKKRIFISGSKKEEINEFIKEANEYFNRKAKIDKE